MFILALLMLNILLSHVMLLMTQHLTGSKKDKQHVIHNQRAKMKFRIPL